MKIRSVVATGLLITVAFVAHAADEAPHWGYGGEHGPKKWGDMEAGFSACKLGKEQSPIDIRNAKKSALPALDFKYTKSSAEVVNNGHTIQVNLVDGGVLNLDGVPYGLVQFHFHAPSEEKINGKAYPMEAHLVHQSTEGKLAVVALMLTEGIAILSSAPCLKTYHKLKAARKHSAPISMPPSFYPPHAATLGTSAL